MNKVLIVEDSENSMHLFSILVKKCCPECKVLKASSVKQAKLIIEKQEENTIDFAMIDMCLNFERCAGVNVSKLLREKSKDAYVILMSAAVDPLCSVEELLKHGVIDKYISKPITIQNFEKTIIKVGNKELV